MKGRPSVYPASTAPKVKWAGKVERLAWGGLGVGREIDGRLILLSAPLALFPGEEVEAEVRWKARHGEGEVLRWVKPDARRVPSACPVARLCGGCELWEAGSRAAELKRLMVEDLLRRQLPEMDSWEWRPAPVEARRHRIQLHWAGRQLGFHRRRSHAIVPVKHCPAASPGLSDAIPRLLEALEEGALPSRPQRWELATGTPAGEVFASLEDGRAWKLEPDGWHPTQEAILHRHQGAELRHRAGGFFQVCAPWAMTVFGEVLEGWEVRGETLFDLYGGVGLFSALLRERFHHFVLVESEPNAVAWARKNLAGMGLPAECHATDAADWIPEGLGEPSDVILVDPPRVGLAPAFADTLKTAHARTLVLVGCDGAAFCRDVKRLAPEWELEKLTVLDLFPLTAHAEFLGLLRRKP
jgi:23S rRNA (uracil1939-C5)-methyltransferase